jgi:formiminotetrahydrofolate cyclodeaminase
MVHDATASIGQYLAATASPGDAPAGASAAALAAALASALAQLVARIKQQRKEGADPSTSTALIELQRAQALLLELMAEDQVAYGAYRAARALPADTPQAQEQVSSALLAAIRVPQAIAATAVAVLEHAAKLADVTTGPLLADLGVAAELCMATVRGAGHTIAANLATTADRARQQALQQEQIQLRQRALRVIQHLGTQLPASRSDRRH